MTEEYLETKRKLLKTLVGFYSDILDIYYQPEMLSESTPEYAYLIQEEIYKLRKELAGA